MESWGRHKTESFPEELASDSALKDEQDRTDMTGHSRKQEQLAQGVGLEGGIFGITGQCCVWGLREGREGRLWPDRPGPSFSHSGRWI